MSPCDVCRRPAGDHLGVVAFIGEMAAIQLCHQCILAATEESLAKLVRDWKSQAEQRLYESGDACLLCGATMAGLGIFTPCLDERKNYGNWPCCAYSLCQRCADKPFSETRVEVEAALRRREAARAN